MNFIMNNTLAVERIVVEKDAATPYKKWKKEAAVEMAKKILDADVMCHHSCYDLEHLYLREAFTLVVGTPERKLP